MPQFKGWGAAHAGGISYVFGNFSEAMHPNAADRAVSDEMSSYWVNFARTGDPNGKGLPRWPAFTDANAQVMSLNDSSMAISVPNSEKLRVLDGYYAWHRSKLKT